MVTMSRAFMGTKMMIDQMSHPPAHHPDLLVSCSLRQVLDRSGR